MRSRSWSLATLLKWTRVSKDMRALLVGQSPSPFGDWHHIPPIICQQCWVRSWSEANWKPLHSSFTKPWLSESHNFYYSTFQDPGWYFLTFFIKYVSWAWTSTWYDQVRWFLFLVHIRGSAPPCLQSHITSRISPIVVHYPDWRLMQGSVDRIKSINNNSRHSIRRWYIRIMRQ